MKLFTRDNFASVITEDSPRDFFFAFYSSIWGAATTDPALMLVPLEDHLVHRGDGVFDSAKCIGGKVFNFDAHIARLLRCAKAVGLESRWSADEIKRLCHEVIAAGQHPDCSLRIIISRGPGGMGVAPADSPAPALYIATYKIGTPFMETHPEGGRLVKSAIVAKQPQFATVKSCNYIQNALMKAELSIRDADFICSFDANGFLAEGPVENDGIVTSDGILAFPKPGNILAGTTMELCIEFGKELVRNGLVKGVERRDITEEDMLSAREIFATGTTIHVVAMREFEGHPVGDGKPGPVAKALASMLEDAMAAM